MILPLNVCNVKHIDFMTHLEGEKKTGLVTVGKGLLFISAGLAAY